MWYGLRGSGLTVLVLGWSERGSGCVGTARKREIKWKEGVGGPYRGVGQRCRELAVEGGRRQRRGKFGGPRPVAGAGGRLGDVRRAGEPGVEGGSSTRPGPGDC